VHPTLPVFVTACLDGSLRLFSALSRSLLLARVGIQDSGGALLCPTCCGFSCDGSRLAVGFASGHVALLDAETLEDVTAATKVDVAAKLPGAEGSMAAARGVVQIGFSADDVGLVVHRGHAVMLHDPARLDVCGPYCGIDELADPIVRLRCSADVPWHASDTDAEHAIAQTLHAKSVTP
jgi:hypothetical protein